MIFIVVCRATWRWQKNFVRLSWSLPPSETSLATYATTCLVRIQEGPTGGGDPTPGGSGLRDRVASTWVPCPRSIHVDGIANLFLTILGQFPGQGACHVAGKSRPSDRPGGRPRSCFPRPFCKKALELKRNQPAVQVPLLENFAKKPSAFLKINPQSNSAGWRKFTNKTLSFNKINPPSLSSLRFFSKKPSDFNWIKPQLVSSITSTRATLYV